MKHALQTRIGALLLSAGLCLGALPVQARQSEVSDDQPKTAQDTALGQRLAQTKTSEIQLSRPDDSQEVIFIVELNEKCLLDRKARNQTIQQFLKTGSGKSALSSIETSQKKAAYAMESLDDDSSVEIVQSYHVVLNGFAVKAPASYETEFAAISGVKSVRRSRTYTYEKPVYGYTAISHTSGDMMKSDSVNELGYTGKGTLSAVLDTGLDVSHEAFAKAPEGAVLTKEKVAQILAEDTLIAKGSAEDLYKSEKVPFAYDYADEDSDVLGPENHGTHVSGTIGADGTSFTGVAPDTQLLAMKVFSDASEGADDSWIYAALEDCVLLGVDTINMSLGSGSGFSSDDDAREVYQRVLDAGIVLMASAGNDTDSVYNNESGTDLAKVGEPDTGVVGSPSTYEAAMSVASVNEAKTFSSYLRAADGDRILYLDANAGTDLDFSASFNNRTLEYVVINGLGEESDYEDLDVKGKIVLVPRGTITFVEKEAAAANAGAAAIVVYNNVEGDLVSMQLEGLIPSVFISQASGQALKDKIVKTLFMSQDNVYFDTESFANGEMSSFSSMGVTPDLLLKPEITAPGGNVYSTLPGNAYGNMSGTSMASPHMAGAAAVMIQYVQENWPELSRSDRQSLVNTLLMNTAVPVEDPDGTYYSVRKQGAGLANISKAVAASVYVSVEGSDRPKAELKDSPDGNFVITIRLSAHNLGDKDCTFQPSVTALTSLSETAEDAYGENVLSISSSQRVLKNDELQADFSIPAVTVPAGGEVSFSVTLTLTDKGKESLEEFVNGTFIDGWIVLEGQNEFETLRVPFMGFYGDWGKAPIFDKTLYDEQTASVMDCALISYDDNSGGMFYLGANLFDTEYLTVPDEDKIAITADPETAASYYLYSYAGLLRAPEVMFYTIVDSDNQVILESQEEHVPKTYYTTGGYLAGCFGPTEDGWQTVSQDEEGETVCVPDGDYTLEMRAKAAGTSSSAGTQSLSLPFVVDSQKPEVVSASWSVDEESGDHLLQLEVRDNHYLQAMELISTDGSYSDYSDVIIVDEDARGAVTTHVFDVEDLYAQNITEVSLLAYDYAMNELESDPIAIADSYELLQMVIQQAQDALSEGDSSATPAAQAAFDALQQALDESLVLGKDEENEILDAKRDELLEKIRTYLDSVLDLSLLQLALAFEVELSDYNSQGYEQMSYVEQSYYAKDVVKAPVSQTQIDKQTKSLNKSLLQLRLLPDTQKLEALLDQ